MSSKDLPALLKEENGCICLRPERITIDANSILRIQGYRDLEKVRAAIKKAALLAAQETENLISPQVYFRKLPVQQCYESTLILDGGTKFDNEAFQRFLGRADHVVVFILTMGHALDEAVKDAIADDLLMHALFLETAGWLGIEAATRTLSVHLRTQARQSGHRLSPRLGPGYSYKLDGRSVFWPLEQQQNLFELFAHDAIDVQILESCAMLPKISRSGLYGLLPVS